jgi:putative copper resistance protein D
MAAASPLADLLLADVWAINVGLSLVLGSLASHAWLRHADSPWSNAARAQGKSALRAGMVVTLLGLLCAVWIQAAVMGDATLLHAGPAATVLLRDTHFGRVATAGWAAWFVVAAATWRAEAFGPSRLAFIALGLTLLFWSRSAVSHAGSQGDISFDVLIDVVHRVAACLWVGAVLFAASLWWPPIGASVAQRLDAARWVAALSSAATLALVVVLLSGALRIWRSDIDLMSLVRSDYGGALYSKLALVAMAVALGGFNRFRVLPGLFVDLHAASQGAMVQPWRQRLTTVLRIEAVVLLLVLLAATLLAATEPPGA